MISRTRPAGRVRDDESYWAASSWTLMRRKFFRHKLAMIGGSVLLLFYVVGSLFAGFFSTHDTLTRFPDFALAGPQRIRLFHDGRLQRPFVYGLEITRDPETYRKTYVEDGRTVHPIRFLVRGYFGGPLDTLIQRLIEFLGSLPTLPVWMALATAVPAEWDPIATYFMITIILSIVGWTGLARVVRGKLLQLRVEDYVLAAKIAGATEFNTIVRHLLPGFMSFLIVHLTLAIPGMILGETALSFLGIGLRAPVVSWGVLLQQAQNIRSVSLTPWLLIPALFVIVTVLCFNFVGDGLRDAGDPTQDR